MKKSFYIRFNRLIASVLSLFGIGATTCCTKYGLPPEQFGDFKAYGKVTEQSGHAIQGIRVVMKDDTTLTDQNGNFEVKTYDYSSYYKEYQIEFDDIDGVANGEFQSLDTIISFTDEQFPDDGVKEISKELNIQLKKTNK